MVMMMEGMVMVGRKTDMMVAVKLVATNMNNLATLP